MNLFEIIKNLFKHHKINTNKELVRPLDIIKIPKRKEFNNDELVDLYKREYHSILSTMKDYDTLILEAEELNYNILMTSKLLFSIAIKEDIIKEKSIEDRINYLINSEKLDIYREDINKLQKEVIGRLIAISEIRKEYFLNKRKKNAIDNIIDRLSLSLNVLYSIEVGIISNIERYKKESKYNYEPDKEEKEKEYEIFEERIKHLNWLQQILDSDKQIKIRTDVNYILKDLALVEKNIEEYTYRHNEEITEESKNEEINRILEIPFDIEHKEELLKRIEEIERKYRAFYEYRESIEYGTIVIDESDLASIYNLKFSALTISQDGIVDTFVDENTDKIELEYYQNIIFSMVQDIIMGKNEVFNEIFNKDYIYANHLVKEIFIDNNQDILTDFGRLNLLLSFNTKDGLYNLYNNIKFPFSIHSNLFDFDDMLPLETICFIQRAYNKPITFIYHNNKKLDLADYNYYELYLIYHKYYNYEEDKYYLPEGINEITNYNEELNKLDFALVKEINKLGQGKVICMPKSLKRIESIRKLFEDNSLKGIVLNEGLEEIETYSFVNQDLREVSLPSSIKRIAKIPFWNNPLNKIILNINKESHGLLNPKNLSFLFGNLLDVNEALKVKSKVTTLIIHIEEINEDITIDLTQLFFECTDANKRYYVYASGLLKYIKERLQYKRKAFNELQQVLPKSERLAIRKDLKGLLTDLEILNRKLKEYIELNKDEVRKLKSHIEDFNVYKNSYEPTISGLQGTYEIELKPYEAKFKLYRYYNMININEINMFYYAKYTYLTSFDVVEPFVSENTIDEELEYYKEIINSIIEHYKNYKPNNNSEITIGKIIKLNLKLLGNASSEDILKDFYLLNLFLALDNPKRLYNFLHSFNDTFVPRHYTDDKLITFDDVNPLSTSCLIYYYMNIDSTFEVNLYKDKKYTVTKDFLELFHLIYLNYSLDIDEVKKYKEYLKLPNTFYLLPEGIKEINLKNIDNHASVDLKIIQNIQNDLFSKDVIMPKTLKVLKGNLFNDECKGNVYLNEGLETLDVINLAFTDDEEVTIPSSIKEIIGFAPIYPSDYFFKKIVFNNFNFENRKVLVDIFDIFLKTNLRFFIFYFTLIFHYDDLNEDIIPKLDLSLYDAIKFAGDNEYYCQVIEDIVNNIEKEVQEKRGNSKKLEK